MMLPPILALVAPALTGCYPKGGAQAQPETLVTSSAAPSTIDAPPPPPPLNAGVESEGMRVRWAIDGEALRVELSAPTTGWVRIGFNTVRAQHQANMIVAWVDAEGAHAEDRFAVDPPYIEPDVQLGGTDDVTVIDGSEADGRTTVQFSIPLDSGDSRDIHLEPGRNVFLILSYGATDDRSEPAVVRTAEAVTL